MFTSKSVMLLYAVLFITCFYTPVCKSTLDQLSVDQIMALASLLKVSSSGYMQKHKKI